MQRRNNDRARNGKFLRRQSKVSKYGVRDGSISPNIFLFLQFFLKVSLITGLVGRVLCWETFSSAVFAQIIDVFIEGFMNNVDFSRPNSSGNFSIAT